MTQRTNETWLVDLRADRQRQAAALEDLRELILRGLSYVLLPIPQATRSNE